MHPPRTIKLWLTPCEYDALRARLARERLTDLALSERLAREWAELDRMELAPEVEKAA